MQRIVRAWPCAASALLLLLAFPPFNLTLLVFVGLVPWLASLRTCDARAALRSGLCFGLIYGAGQLWWIHQFVSRWTESWALATIPWLMATVLMSGYYVLFGWLAAGCLRKNLPWLVPLVWAGVEVLRSYIPGLAFPWQLLASPMYWMTPFIQSAYFGTIFFVSAWIVLANVMAAMLFFGEGPRAIRGMATVFSAVVALSLYRMTMPAETDRMTVTAGQTGYDLAFGDRDREDEEVAINSAQIVAGALADGTDLLVFPEGISSWPSGPDPITPIGPRPPLAFLTGGKRGENPVFQSAFGWDPARGTWEYADKTRLVIFGEFVPFREYLPFLRNFNLAGGDLRAGETLTALTFGGRTVGPIICFEAMFPDLAYRQSRAGATLLAVISVDDWFMESWAMEGYKACAVWRAAETGTPTVRAASLGYTLITDRFGTIVAEMPLRSPGGLRATIPVPRTAQAWPLLPVFPVLALASLVAVPLLLRRREG